MFANEHGRSHLGTIIIMAQSKIKGGGLTMGCREFLSLTLNRVRNAEKSAFSPVRAQSKKINPTENG